MIKERRERQTCISCKKDFMVIWKTLPSKMDDKRDTYYLYPYCDKKCDVHLLGNEEVDTEKID